MKAGELLLVTGGARSGKSTFAENYAQQSGKDIVYIATCQGLDEEMSSRIEAHRRRRPDTWKTIEEPLGLAGSLLSYGRSPQRLLLIDCLTLWLSNSLLSKAGFDGERLADEHMIPGMMEKVLTEARNVAVLAAKVPAQVVVVTNEVGQGLVPENRLGRLYRDLAGQTNSLLAARADKVYLLVAGLPVRLK